MKKTTNFCDICKTCNGHISTDKRIQTISYSIDPTGNSDYSATLSRRLSIMDIDLCEKCLERIMEGNPVYEYKKNYSFDKEIYKI